MSKKKPNYPVCATLADYLGKYGRKQPLPVTYDDLTRYMETVPLFDRDGKDTLWETVVYDHRESESIQRGLTKIYAQLHSQGNVSNTEHLFIERVDFCTFGNSQPFRIRVVNQFNDNYDHFYIKKADASRIYGLELEDLLSPNRIGYLATWDTLVEEHIAGIPGDKFLEENMLGKDVNRVRLAKEFVKFNERCFVRLLGDMRTYNYVLVVTPDFEEEQYRVRAIDFDQQCYEGRKTIYLPQFFKENRAVVDLVSELLNPKTIRQYQFEERSLMARRFHFAGSQIRKLITTMRGDELSSPEKVEQLREELADFHKEKKFLFCRSMGDIVYRNILFMLGE